MTTKEILKATAIKCLQEMIWCNLLEDYEGLPIISSMYTDTLKDIEDLSNTTNNYPTEAQLNYVFESDLQIDATGKLISTPE